MNQKTTSNFLEDESWQWIVEDTKARQHVLFSGLNGGLTNKARHAAYSEQGGADPTVAHIKNK